MRTYHGWIVVEEEIGITASVSTEFIEADGQRKRVFMTRRGNSGCAEAVEWWDKRLGRTCFLEPTLRGCYRVYTDTVATGS
jgi:hypothetical protein